MMYIDERGGLAPYKLPRKLKKKWRKELVARMVEAEMFVKRIRLWYAKRRGWTAETIVKNRKSRLEDLA